MWHETERIFLDSTGAVLRAAARILPSVLAMLLVFGLAAVVALAVRWAVRRACAQLRVDERVRRWGGPLPGEAERAPPSTAIARLSFWAVLVAGAFLGVSALDTPAAGALSMRAVEYVPRAVVAFAIVGAGVVASRYVERSVLIGAVNMGLQSARLVAVGVRWLVVLFAAAIALEHAGVGAGVVVVAFGTLFGGVVLALALAVGLGSRDLVARSLERHFPPGDAPRPGEEEDPGRAKLRHL